MESRRAQIAVALAGVALAVALFLVLSGDSDDGADAPDPAPATTQARETDEGGDRPSKPEEPQSPAVPVVEVKGGKPVGGVRELEFESGERAEFEVVADAADELHLHGYELYVDVAPGKPKTVAFPADIEGLFELESHTTGELLAEISVVPG